MTVSSVARRHGVAPNQLFMWRRLVAQGGLTAAGSGEEVVSASDHRLEGLLDHPNLLGRRPAPPMLNRRDNLDSVCSND